MARRLVYLVAVLAVAAGLWWYLPAQAPDHQQAAVPEASNASSSAESSGGDKPSGVATGNVDAPTPAPVGNAAAPTNAAPPPGQGRISGKVLARNGEQIAGAQLTVSTGAETTVAISDAAGQFSFDLAPGRYHLASVTADGFSRPREPMVFAVEADQTIEGVVIVVDPRADSAANDLEDSGALPFGGRVVDAEDKPVSGAEVSARGTHGTIYTNSGAEGRFQFPTTIGGPFMVHATHRNRVSPTVRVQDGATDVVLKLSTEGGFITGRVTGPSGGTQPSFTVWLSRPVGRLEERNVGRRPFASPKGEYRIGPLTPGDYRVRADAFTFAPSAPKAVSVTAGASAVADLQLRPGATLAGTVLDADTGSPIPAATVRLESSFLDDRVTKADASGRFNLPGLPPGLFSVQASADGFHSRSVSGLTAVEGQPGGPIEIRLNALKSDDERPKNQLAGIGAGLQAQGDSLVVTQVVKGGGAAEVGITVGDLILTIDGRSVAELDFNGVIQLIRGPEGSTVLLDIQRDGNKQTINVPRRAISR